MTARSWLFVPGDRPDRFGKALASGADAIILDLEDSVSLDRKDVARAAVAAFLADGRSANPARIIVAVRINPVSSGLAGADIGSLAKAAPDVIVLPKAEGAASLRLLDALLAPHGLDTVPVLPIATETPAAIFQLGTYSTVQARLAGLTWGAEDLPAAIGAETSREETGAFTAPYELVRSLTLFGAAAAGAAPIDTVFPALADEDALCRYATRAARDGFVGMMALHPRQVSIINAAFTPSPERVAQARAVIAAFEAAPEAGVLQLNGQMIDAPHLAQARRIIERLKS